MAALHLQTNTTHSSGLPPLPPTCRTQVPLHPQLTHSPPPANSPITAPTHSHSHLGEALIKHTLGGPAPREGLEVPTLEVLNRGGAALRDAFMGAVRLGIREALSSPNDSTLSPSSANGTRRLVRDCGHVGAPTPPRAMLPMGARSPHVRGRLCAAPHCGAVQPALCFLVPQTPISAAIFPNRRFSAEIRLRG